jgi:hypothetical protein
LQLASATPEHIELALQLNEQRNHY